MEMRMLNGRVALVTGSTSGIGLAIADALAGQGADLVLNGFGEATVIETIRDGLVARHGVRVIHVAADMARPAEIDSLVAAGERHFGRLDILVNNAGITKDGLLLRMSDEDWGTVLQTNLTSAFIAARVAGRLMMKNRFGRIVNIGSTSGIVGNAGQANYAAAKAGLVGLSKSIARELGGKGITCNVVAPGYIETDMTASLPEEIKQKIQDMVAVRRLGTVDDIAAAVAYVTSDDAGFLTGQTLIVDGGMTMA
jgi:3-oxoacyl-[acyl-carrier protein] reductase